MPQCQLGLCMSVCTGVSGGKRSGNIQTEDFLLSKVRTGPLDD